MHDPAKVVLDLAVGLALGGDCLADVALLRAEPRVFGRVASDPTVSRTIDRLPADADRVLAAIDGARRARRRSWRRRSRGCDRSYPRIKLPTLRLDQDRRRPTRPLPPRSTNFVYAALERCSASR